MKFKNLLAEMTKLGITEKELAKLTGIKNQTLSKKKGLTTGGGGALGNFLV